ncbi:hypothetical protein [Williamsia sp.]|uniref:hypothetical protein n=1 Tax=Williamsia sp. TaxID=1872085 RepID=UPI002F957ABA
MTTLDTTSTTAMGKKKRNDPFGFRPTRRTFDQWVCLWMYPVAMVALTLAMFTIGPLMPPIAPSKNPEEVAEIYRGTSLISIPIVVLLFVNGLQVPLQGLAIAFIRKMPRSGKLFGNIYLGVYAAVMLPTTGTLTAIWGVLVLRPERDPAMIQMLNDVCYLILIAVISGFLIQYSIIAIAIFVNGGKVLPLWFGYVSVWAAVSELLFLPAFVWRTGPFAWNGLLDFWLGIIIFGIWMVGLVLAIGGAIKDSVPRVGEPDDAQDNVAQTSFG